MFGAVTDMASRSHYLWLGATFTKFYEHSGSKRPDVTASSTATGHPSGAVLGPMGLAHACRACRRTLRSICFSRNRYLTNSSSPSFPWPIGARHLPQLHRRFRSSSCYLPEHGLPLSERARSFCREFQLLVVSAQTQGEIIMVLLLLLVASVSLPTRAEIRSIDITIFGID
jgi:hypothetical protein